MNKPAVTPSQPQPTLRLRAEAALRTTRSDIADMPAEEIQRLLHELQVHQIELEMQNEELRHAQGELAQSRDRFNDLYDFSPVGYVTLHQDGTVIEANLTLAAMLGVARNQLVGHKFTHFVAPAAQDTLYLHQRAVFGGDQKQICELLLHGPNGATFHARMETIRDSASAIRQNRSAISDITQRKQAEDALARFNATLEKQVAGRTQELRESEGRYRQLIHALPAAVFMCDVKGRILLYNAAAAKLWGREPSLSRERWSGAYRIFSLNGKRLRPVHYPIAMAVRQGEPIRDVEMIIERPDGSRSHVLAFPDPIHDSSGTVIGAVSMLVDITESRRGEAALREREERLRAILNTVTDAIITIDKRGTVTSVNPAATRMFGYAEAEMVGSYVSMLVPAAYREEYDRFLENYQRTGQARVSGVGREAQGQRKDGTAFPVELAVSEIDHLQIVTAVVRDISERNELEAEVLRISEEERRRVAADLHDGICQELVGIQYLAILLLRDLEKAHHPLASQARRIEEAIIRTTTDARQVARGLNPVVADGSGLMHALRQLAAMTARSRRIRCLFQCPEPVSIEDPATANELYRIAQEAIHNAVRHGRAKRITVRLGETGDDVCLAVIDNGGGILTDVSTTLGMGLRVMRHRARVIGGQLTIQPRPRGGTEVLCRVAKAFSNR